MKKEKNRVVTRETTQVAVRRDENNKNLRFAATNKIETLFEKLNTSMNGLDEDGVASSLHANGDNKVTHENRKSLLRQ